MSNEDLLNLIKGVFRGMQKDPNVKSQCVTEIEAVAYQWQFVSKSVYDLITYLHPPEILTLIFQFSETMNHVAFTIEQCFFRTLTNKITELISTWKGKFLFVGLILGSLPHLIDTIDKVGESITNMEYGLAGYYIGNVIKVTLDYEY
jgi:hypothetical protein